MGLLFRGLLLVSILKTSECLQLTVQPDEVSTVTLSTSLSLSECGVCALNDQGVEDCATSQKIEPSQNVTVRLNCTEPEKTISVLIESRIECTKDVCTPEQGNVLDSFLSRFNRRFVWTLKATAETKLVVDFPGDGLKKVAEGESCSDGYSYTVAAGGSGGVTQTQKFCRNGSVAHLELLNQATVTLLVSQKENLAPSQFTVKPTLQKKARTINVTPEIGTWVEISRKTEGPVCTVCVGEGPSQTCGSSQTLSEVQSTTVAFSCPNPQDVFTVKVNRELDCSKGCSSDTIHTEFPFFNDFNRTFIWDLKVSPTNVFQLDFPASGMRQIPSSEKCPDKHTYSVLMYLRGAVSVGTFCQSGPISRMRVLYKGRVSLEVAGGTPLNASDFKYSETSGSASVIVVDATLPRGQSDTDFFSASVLPNDNVMTWNFVVPPKHNFSINFFDTTKPECQKKEVKVTYKQDNKPPIDKALTDVQPTNYQGSFSLSLTNCDSAKKGLFLGYKVSVFRSGIPDCCTVDLQKDQGLSLQIENTNPDSFCELRMDSTLQEKITVPPGSQAELCFLDCPRDELFLTAIKTIECQSLSSCSASGSAITVPSLDSCLPTALRQVKWNLRVPDQGSVELSSPRGSFQQSVPGQGCDGPVSLLLSETDGSSIGRFCSYGNQGTIQRVQISSSVTVTAVAEKIKDLSQEKDPFINIIFGPKVSDDLIYTMSVLSNPVLLATPNWPGGMRPDSTVSWVVTIPEDYGAELLFVNVSKPSCKEGHSKVTFQEIGAKEEQSYREDETFEKFNIKNNFYVNMSNCDPDRDTFAVLSKISLQKKSRKLLSIILAVVGALLVLMIIILAVVCVVVRKKKRQINRSSIFIPKGPVSLPGDASFPKSRADNESHVYASIDETMIYGHLLEGDKDPDHFNGHPMGTYRTFTGPMDMKREAEFEPEAGQGAEKETYRPFLAPSETFVPSRPRTPLGPLDSVGFEDRRMVDNELYTFKNPDPNPIRLSAMDPLPLPESETSSTSEFDEPEPVYDDAM